MKNKIVKTSLTRRPHRYEIVAFLTGFSVLVLELSGARLISPFFGTSTYIWTAIIGVVLGSLAIGNIVGGVLADKLNPTKVITSVLLAGSVAALLMALTQQEVLATVATFGLDVRLAAFIAAVLLFGVPSLLIGVVYPCLAKIQLKSLELAGESIGRLEAAGTFGSIAGTFLTGYVFLGYFGSQSIVIGVALLLLLTALIAGARLKSGLVLAILLLATVVPFTRTAAAELVADVDTRYARYQVFELFYGGEIVRALVTDNRGIQSAVSVADPSKPVFSYIQRFYEIAEEAPRAEEILLVGGGSYSFPYVLTKNFSAEKIQRIDVVEIDDALEQLAKDYFYYQPSDRIVNHKEDGRTYLNKNQRQYDIIYLDAFTSSSPPFQLTTKEFVGKLRTGLRPDGAVVTNLISRYEDGTNDYLRALLATYQEEFAHVGIYSASLTEPSDGPGNFILVASNDFDTATKYQTAINTPALPVASGGQILTDDFAPIERLTY